MVLCPLFADDTDHAEEPLLCSWICTSVTRSSYLLSCLPTGLQCGLGAALTAELVLLPLYTQSCELAT